MSDNLLKANTNFGADFTGFDTNGLYINPTDNMSFSGLANSEPLGFTQEISNSMGKNIMAGSNAASDFGLGDFGSALGEGWDFLSGGLDTLTGLADLYMKWDGLQSTKASVRDSHNASAEQYNNYLKRSKNATLSQGLVPTSGASARTNVARSTV